MAAADVAAPAAPTTIPRAALRRRRLPADRNRPHEILAVLVMYILVVHFALKFAAFFLPEESPSPEDLLGANGVRGWSLGRSTSLRRGTERCEDVGSGGFPNCLGGGIPSGRYPGGGRASMSSFQRDGGGRRMETSRFLTGSAREDLALQELHGIRDGEKIDNSTDANAATPQQPAASTVPERRPRIPVLSYRDSYVIVSKPPGMTMHHNSESRWGRSKSPVLEMAIKRQLSRKPYLVHRLDHRTSGAVILGFDSETAGRLHGRLRGDDAVKLYVALVRGDLRDRFRDAAAADDNYAVDLSAKGDGSVVGSRGKAPKITVSGVVEPPSSSHNEGSADEYAGKITVDLPVKANGVEKEARTEFYFLSSREAPVDEPDEPIGPYVTKSLTLLLCRPRTGRTHQIRRHLQRGLCAPIVGDSEHGDSRVNRHWREAIGLDRLGLHCLYLGLPPSPPSDDEASSDPGGDDDAIECVAPLTPDFAAALGREELGPLWEEARRIEPRLGMKPYDERGGTFGRHYRKMKETAEGT